MPGRQGMDDQAEVACRVVRRRMTDQASPGLVSQHIPCYLGKHRTWRIPRSRSRGHEPVQVLVLLHLSGEKNEWYTIVP